MNQNDFLAEQFEGHRTHLQGVAYRMLGSLSEADDAVQAAWLRLSRSDANTIENMGGWLTTVVARVCLDMLRSRRSRREETLDSDETAVSLSRDETIDPEREALLADSVGLALLVILDTLEPAERLAFVLHDLFAMPFEEIAPIVGRTATTTRQLASRARRRVRGNAVVPEADLSRQREVINAFLAATRAGDFNALLTLLDPDVVFTDDGVIGNKGVPRQTQGAAVVAKQFARPGNARATQPALINGGVGIVVAPYGKLLLVLKITITNGKISAINAVGDPAQLEQYDFGLIGE